MDADLPGVRPILRPAMPREETQVSRPPAQFVAFQVNPAGELYEKEFLALITSVESKSQHPLARAVADIGRKNGHALRPVIGFKEFPGEGIGGAVEVEKGVYRALVIGKRGFIKQCGLHVPEILEVAARRWEKEPDVIIALAGWDGWVRGVLKFKRGNAG